MLLRWLLLQLLLLSGSVAELSAVRTASTVARTGVTRPRQPIAAPSPSSTAAPGDTSSNDEAADDTSSNDFSAPDLDNMLLANITTSYLLPKEAATWTLGGVVLLKGIDSMIKSSMESLPEVSLFMYVMLLGAFSSMVGQIYWTESTRLSLLSELGPYLTLSGLFAQSMLLITPLLLLLPDQNAAEEVWVGAGMESAQKTVTSCFQSSGLKRVMLFVYLVLAAFQVVSVYSFYRLAELQEEALQDSQTIQLVKGQEGTSPYGTSVLYLLLAWCSVITMYEYLFDASFAEDFPQNVLRRLVGASVRDAGEEDGEAEATEDDSYVQSSGYDVQPSGYDVEPSGYSQPSRGYMQPPRLIQRGLRGLQGSAPYRTVHDAKRKLVDEGQKLIDSVKAIMPTTQWMKYAHLALYVIYYLLTVAVIAVLEVKMLYTTGISPFSVLFLVLTCGLELFVCIFSLFACCGVKAHRAEYQSMPQSAPAMRIQPSASPAAESHRRGRERVSQEGETDAELEPLGQEEHESRIEREILYHFGEAVEAAFTHTFVKSDSCCVIVVPRRGREQAVATDAHFGIADLVSRMLTWPSRPEVRILDANEFSAIRDNGDSQAVMRERAFGMWPRCSAPSLG